MANTPESSRTRRWPALAGFAALELLTAVSCAAGTAPRDVPVAVLGSTVAAERKFRPLMRAWVYSALADRLKMDNQIEAFIERFEGDDLVRVARLLLAFNALERGELAGAEALAREAMLGPAGTARDLATVVVGAVERRRGDHKAALRHLRPLLHKMLDPFATAILNRELVEAALGAQDWQNAIMYMEAWLRETSPADRPLVAERLTERLVGVLPAEREAWLDGGAGAQGGDAEMGRLVAESLAAHAIESHNVDLARKLLERYRALLGGYGEAVAKLAADRSRAKVLSDTVGLLLSIRSNERRRRSADVATGMAFGLGLPGDAARLVTRSDREGPRTPADLEGDIEEALHGLAAAGAAVIVAGIDPLHARVAARFARAEELPVLLLLPEPGVGGGPADHVFLLGEDPTATARVMVDAVAPGRVSHVAALGLVEQAMEEHGLGAELWAQPACDVDAATLRARRIDAVVIADGALCARDVTEAVARTGLPLAIGLGVTWQTVGASREQRLPASTRALRAGVFPVEEGDTRLEGWSLSRRGMPGWWVALGRDAAALAALAVAELAPRDEKGRASPVTEERLVRERRRAASRVLSGANVQLWTSDARGFGGARRLPRSIEVGRGDAS